MQTVESGNKCFHLLPTVYHILLWPCLPPPPSLAKLSSNFCTARVQQKAGMGSGNSYIGKSAKVLEGICTGTSTLEGMGQVYCKSVTESWDGVWKQLGKSAKVLEGICTSTSTLEGMGQV